MYAFGCFFGLLAIAVSRLSSVQVFAIGALVAAAELAAVALLERAPYERQAAKNKL
jgi:hypothetical protein